VVWRNCGVRFPRAAKSFTEEERKRKEKVQKEGRNKRPVLTDARCIQRNATVTAANVNEVTEVLRVLTEKPAVFGKPGPERELPDRLQGNRAYDSGRLRGAALVGHHAGTGQALHRAWRRAWASSAGSSSVRYPGCIRWGGCAAAWMAAPKFKKCSGAWVAS
jgi:hypothetical protein